jgi:cellulose synthase/poly-beta-1,6-N-acetylglucosamine synthase-like glycosyltransferase
MYNEKKVAERVLKACSQIDYPHFEIVVIDDSTDETTAIVRSFAKEWNQRQNTPGVKSADTPGVNHQNQGPLIKVIHRKNRQGFKGGALAYALNHMDKKTEFVVVLDSDFVPYPDTLEMFLKYFQVTAGGLDFQKRSTTSKVTRPRPDEVGKSADTLKVNYQKNDSKIAAVGGYQWHVLRLPMACA